MTDSFSPVPQSTSNTPAFVDNFAPVPVVKSKGPQLGGAGASGAGASGEGTDFDPTAMLEGDRSSGPGGAGHGHNRESRPEAVDKAFKVLP